MYSRECILAGMHSLECILKIEDPNIGLYIYMFGQATLSIENCCVCLMSGCLSTIKWLLDIVLLVLIKNTNLE
jgi:hypothetical protein